METSQRHACAGFHLPIHYIRQIAEQIGGMGVMRNGWWAG
jgi:hypothetical protein